MGPAGSNRSAHLQGRAKDTLRLVVAVAAEADIEAYHSASRVLATSSSEYGLESSAEEMLGQRSLSETDQEEDERRICWRRQPLVHCSKHVPLDTDLDAMNPPDPAGSLPSLRPGPRTRISKGR